MKNKRIVVIGTLLITIAAMIVASTSITTASDWPLYRNNPGNTAAIPETINLPLTEHWHSSAPAVEENGAVVYNNIVYMCSDASYLYAFNVSTGAILPGYPANIGFTYGSPSIDTIHNLVYVLCEDSYLYAFHLNGTTAWTKNVEGSGTNYNEGPLVDDGYVYVKEGGALQKYDYTGALQWSSLANGYNTQPSIMGNYVYTNDESGSIHKFNKTTGLETLTGGFPIPTGYSSSALTTVDGKIFHKADLLYAYDASNGNLLWSQPCGSSSTWYDSPAVSNGVVYVYGYTDSFLYAFNESTGATMAGFPSVALNPTGDRNWNSPAVAGDKVFIGAGTSQKLKVVGAAGSAYAGQILEEHLCFSQDTQGFDLCSPIISNGVVLAMLDGGGLYAFFGSGVNWSGGAIVINNGENCTGSRDVTLTLSNGSIPDVVEMRISEDPYFTGVSWEPFATTKQWTLSEGLGMKTVYAQFKNGNGELSNVFNDQIDYSEECGGVVDSTPPVVTKTIGDPQYEDGLWVNLSTPITLTATDPGDNASGVKEIHYLINGVETIVEGSETTFMFQEECNHILEFWAVDNAGNIGDHTTQTHYVDDTAPSQTVQFGQPYVQHFIYHNNNWYAGIGPTTPIWINSTDMGCNGGVGSKYLSYNLYIGQQYGDWVLHASNTVYDNEAGDMNPATGKISVVLYMDESCWHQIHYWCADQLGNREPPEQNSYLNVDFVVDATGPTTQVSFGLPHLFLNNDDYISCDTPITVYGNDTGCVPNGSGVAKVDWSVDKKLYDDVWQTVQTGTVYDNDQNDLNPAVGKIVFIIYMTESCEHHIYSQATDYFGNLGPQDKRYVRVDCTPPVTTKEIGEPKYYDSGQDITYVTTQTPIWLNTTDEPGDCAVGCDYLHWEIYIFNQSSQNWTLLSWGNEESNKALLYFNEECYHKLVWWAVDYFGNTEDTHVQFHKVDNTPPTTIKEYGSPQCIIVDDEETMCITSHTPIYLNATDGGLCAVGSYIIHYQVWYNGQWSDWMQGDQTTDVVLTMDDLGAPFNEDCMHYINYYAVDDLGNTEITQNQTFYVDNTPPVIVKTVGDPNCTIDDDTYCILPTTPITIDAYNTGCCTDTGLTLRYNINNGDWVYPTYLPVTFTIPEECEHVLTIEAWDCLGNTATDVETFYVHTTPPTIIKTIGDPKCDHGEGTYCVTPETPITLEATTEGCGDCGPITIEYNIGYNDEWTGWLPYQTPIHFTEGCIHTLVVRAYDCLGNGMDPQYWDTEIFYVDNTTPVIEKIVGDPNCSCDEGTYCVTTQTLITINAYDDGCCNDFTVTYRVNQGEWIDITSSLPYTFSFMEECSHTLDIMAVDCVGHQATDTETFYVDDTPPVINLTVGEPNCYCENENDSHYCVTTQTPITITATDAGCCTCEDVTILYRIGYDDEWTDWMPYNGSFMFTEECTHVLEIKAMDCLGNTAFYTETFYVDEQPPVLVKTVGNPHVYLGVDEQGHDQWMIYPLTPISFSAEDQGCCPCLETTIYYRYWYLGVWTDWTIYTSSITLHKGCVHYLEAYTLDCLGNQGEVDNETFWVCTSGEAGPTVTFLNPINGSTHCERTLDVIIKATDDITPSKNLTVSLWMDGGRRNAPTFWYTPVYNETDGYFHAAIDIHEYQNGAQLTLQSWALDEDGYMNFALPVTFTVCSDVAYDQWHQLGWNSLVIPYGAISCSYTVEDVLGSIKGNYDWVWFYDMVHNQWSSWYKDRDPGFNTLTMMYPGELYWVYMNQADRYYTDTMEPMVAVTYPTDGATFNTSLDMITGTAFDNGTGIDHVEITLYDSDTMDYWDGNAWGPTATALLCTGTESWTYDMTGVPQPAGHYLVTATATDNVGCTAQDAVSYSIISQNCSASRTYTTDADFDEGNLTNLEHTSVHNQLQIIPGEVTTYPIMWVANAGEDTISKWDTHTDKELARYPTWFGPPGDHSAWSGAAPSRTCVDAQGNCYVANRHFDYLPADVIKIYTSDWVDRNHNGVLDTSIDKNNDGTISPDEMLPMTDTNGNNHIDPEEIVDERVAWAVSIGPDNGLGRSLAIDLEGNIWLGLYNSQVYYKLSSVDGSILGGPYTVGYNTPYGALVDRYGILWGSSLTSNLLKLDTRNPTNYTVYPVPATYGLALGYDADGYTHVYLGYNCPYVDFDSHTETYSYPAPCVFSTLGVATDSKGNIVVGDAYGSGNVAKFAPNGTLLWEANGQVNSEVRGMQVDSEDNVWAIHRDVNKLCKYNGTTGAPLGVFNAGLQPYTYSDATGLGYMTSVSVGSWNVIHDSKALDTQWNKISWTSLEPNGTSITVQVRSSNDQMNWSTVETAMNGVMLSTTPPGRYLNVVVTFTKQIDSDSPILYDLTIDGTCAQGPQYQPHMTMAKEVWVPPTNSTGPYKLPTGGYLTYVYTLADIVLFGYTDNTTITIYDSTNATVWTGTVDDGTYYHQYTSPGVYKIIGDQKFAVLTGDPITNYVMGYYAMDNNGYGANTKLYTYMPEVYSSSYFIVFGYTDGTQVTITNMDTNTTLWSGTLNRGEHYTDDTLDANFVKVESSYPVSALAYNDQGYYVPSANQKWSGTEFYTYADYLGGWPNTLHVMVYEDNTNITVKDTTSDTVIWSGTLNAGQQYETTTSSEIYYSIFTDKTVTVAILPVDGYNNGYYYGCYMMDKDGSGIGTNFYTPTLDPGYGEDAFIWVSAYQNDTTVNVYDAANNTLIGTYLLDLGDAVNVNPGYGYWHIVSDKPISGYAGWGSEAQAAFAPVLFGEAVNNGYWAKSRDAIVGDTVTFRVGVANDGECSFIDGAVTDYLPNAFEYLEGSSLITIFVNGQPVNVTSDMEPWVIPGQNTTMLVWNQTISTQEFPPGTQAYFQFDAKAMDCSEPVVVNTADVTVQTACGDTLNAQDTATVNIGCSEQNNPPNVPSDPVPADTATSVPINATLSWTGGDPDAGDLVTYEVYFGDNSTPSLVTTQYGSTYDPGALAMNTTYYWQIIAKDSYNAVTPGPLWTFTTLLNE